jgi:hypothetical protein
VALTTALFGITPSAPGGAPGPARLLVTGDEWNLVLSRAKIARGRALIQFLNRGEDDHDLRLRRISRSPSRNPIARWAVTSPNDVTSLALRLRSGRYRLWCSLSGHRGLGMTATLGVSAPPNRG